VFLTHCSAGRYPGSLTPPKDLTSCELVLNRRQVRKRTGKASWGWRKVRDVAKDLYGGNFEKAKKHVEGKTSSPDESHPLDPEETWYWVITNRGSLDLENITEESDSVQSRGKLSADQAAELGGQGGLLTLPPKLPGMSTDQSLAFQAGLDNMKMGTGAQNGAGAPKPPEPEKTEEEKEKERHAKEIAEKNAEIVKNQPINKAAQLGERLLVCSSRAHKFGIALRGIGVTDGMATWMTTASGVADSLYKAIQNKTQNKLNTEADYKVETDQANVLIDIFDQYSPLANQMVNRMKPGKKAGEDGAAPKKKARKAAQPSA